MEPKFVLLFVLKDGGVVMLVSNVEDKLPLEDITRGALPLRLHIGSQSQFIWLKLKLTCKKKKLVKFGVFLLLYPLVENGDK